MLEHTKWSADINRLVRVVRDTSMAMQPGELAELDQLSATCRDALLQAGVSAEDFPKVGIAGLVLSRILLRRVQAFHDAGIISSEVAMTASVFFADSALVGLAFLDQERKMG